MQHFVYHTSLPRFEDTVCLAQGHFGVEELGIKPPTVCFVGSLLYLTVFEY